MVDKYGNFFHRVNIEIDFTPPFPLFLFICLLKNSTPNPPPLPPQPPPWIDVERKNKDEMEGLHDNASTFMYLNIKQINSGWS